MRRIEWGFAVLLFGQLMIGSAPVLAQAAASTHCVTPEACFCVTSGYEALIAEKVALFRQRMSAARMAGKLVGYLSVPLSTRAGSYFGVNADVASDIERRILQRFGADAVWILNPSTKDATLLVGGKNGSQGDYGFMWASVLLGEDNTGAALDFVYAAGPQNFAQALGLTGNGDISVLSSYFDNRVQTDPKFAQAVAQKQVTKPEFLSYYAFRAGVAFSAGSHDEWNLIWLVNHARRAQGAPMGIAHQLPVLFDGRAIDPSSYESSIAPGNAIGCSSGG